MIYIGLFTVKQNQISENMCIARTIFGTRATFEDVRDSERKSMATDRNSEKVPEIKREISSIMHSLGVDMGNGKSSIPQPCEHPGIRL